MKKYLRYTIPNIITLIRVILTIIFTILLNNELILTIKDQSIIYLTLIFFIICVTDFIDGRLARYLKVTSIFGSYFDVITDFLYIICSTLILIKFHMIPMWFFIVIIIKFIEFITTSKIINNYKIKREKVFVFDYIGRIAAILFYVAPFIVVFINKYSNGTSYCITIILIYIITIIAFISLIQRIFMCIYKKMEPSQPQEKYR